MPQQPLLTVLFPNGEESWNSFVRRLKETDGDVLAVLTGRDDELVASEDLRATVLDACAAMHGRLRIATKQPQLVQQARAKGLRVIDRVQSLKLLLRGHPKADEAIRVFSPHLWRQQLKTRLQKMGLVSLPKFRIFLLVAVSVGLFFFVIMRLLPSAEIQVWPRQESVSQTINIFLVDSSGSTVELPPRVRTMPLYPIIADIRHSITFDQISKEFIGTSARLAMTVRNDSTEPYSLKKGTRFVNQAGMVFRLGEQVFVDPAKEVTVPAVAEDVDLYNQIIGERGNVPAGLRWDIPGLGSEERKLVFGTNKEPGQGGTTGYRTVLRKEDLEVGRRRLGQELLANAKQLVEEEKILRNTRDRDARLEILYYQELTKTTYSGFVLPTQFLGEPVTSVPIEGSIVYTVYAYDQRSILDLLKDELLSHVREGKELLTDTLTLDRLVVHVIDYADDLSWIKLTVDLTGTERHILDPLSPTGAIFAKHLRELVKNLDKDEAIRIVKNMPEVDSVAISLWPPWKRTLPGIPSHITIRTE